MGRIKIKSVHYSGDNYYYDSPEFNSGLNIIIGNNGSGKTTFCDLIYFALGGEVDQFKKDADAEHNEIVNDCNNYVELVLSINDEDHSIKREIHSNDISIKYKKIVQEEDEIIEEDVFEVYPVNRNKNYAPFIFSDWILNKLEVKPVSLFDGFCSYIFNIRDIFRLIYYDQETIPKKIYKNPTREDKVQNTVFIRKVIFELLLGEDFEEYYLAVNKLRKAEVERDNAKNVLDEYKKLAGELRSDSNCNIDLNLNYSKQALEKLQEELQVLYNHRESLKRNINNVDYNSEIEGLREHLFQKEEELLSIEKRYDYNSVELFNLRDLERNLKIESQQLKKIIYTNEKLGLFSVNTCPWCLKDIPPQKEGYCPCGNKLGEDENIIFTYNTDEYKKILKSKNKTLKTITDTIEFILEENNQLNESKRTLHSEMKLVQNQIGSYFKQYKNPITFNKIDDIDREISECKDKIGELEEYIKIEEKLVALIGKFSANDINYKELKKVKENLETKAKLDIYEKIKLFNEKYQSLMINSLEDCKQAAIDDETYMPEIDFGRYREKSAYVHVRLMYFYTLLYMSLKFDKIKFPRFLLIDTPDTDGIDTEHLKNMIAQLENVAISGKEYQIILTTFEYPEIYKDNIKEEIFKPNNFLLKKRLKPEDFEDMTQRTWLDDAKDTIKHYLSEAEWDIDNNLVRISVYNEDQGFDDFKEIENIEALIYFLVEEAANVAYKTMPFDSENSPYEIDYDAMVEEELYHYQKQLEDIGFW